MSSILTYLRSFRRHAEPSESDGELLRRFRIQRDEQAFAALVHRHGPMVLGIARRIVGQTDLTEDVFQATFLVAAQRAKQLEDWPSIAGWLVQVTRRTALQAKAKAARRFRHEQQAAAMMTSTTTAEPTQVASHRDVAELLDFELSRLPGKYRIPLVLCHLQGRTKEEAAQQLGWPVGSVSGRLARGKQLLKARLLRRGVVPTIATGVLSVPRLEAGIPPLLVQATTLLAQSIVHKAYPIPVSAAVALAQGVMTSMFLTKLKWAVVTVAILCVGVTGGVWAWSGAGGASQEQAKAPAIATKPTTLLEQLQGLWVVEKSNDPLMYTDELNQRLGRAKLNSAICWKFQGNQVYLSDTWLNLSTEDKSGMHMHQFKLDDSTTPARIDLVGFWGILELTNGKLSVCFERNKELLTRGNYQPTKFEDKSNSWNVILHRPSDYDLLEGIWRQETHNPVTNELERVMEYIFRKNFYVVRQYQKKPNETTIHFSREDSPKEFELHENLKPKGIDWDITSGQTVEKQNSAALEQNDKPRREAILNSIANSVGPAERSLGIYELTPTEFRVYTGGWVPFKVKDNHLVPDPLAPSAKRPKSFTEKLGYHRSTRLEENPGVYTRVERSLKDQVDTSLTPAAIDPNQVSNSAPVSSPKLQDLRQQRLKLAQERMDLLRQVAQMQPQVITQHDLAVAAQTLVDSKLALAKDKKERLQALDEQLQLVKQIADSAEQRYKAGSVLKSDVIAAQLRRLELEIQIEELKAQP